MPLAFLVYLAPFFMKGPRWDDPFDMYVTYAWFQKVFKKKSNALRCISMMKILALVSLYDLEAQRKVSRFFCFLRISMFGCSLDECSF